MARTSKCRYCGCRVTDRGNICSSCNEKLRLIRKIRAILFEIKRGERNNPNDKK